jgi:hypothetical protein
MGDSRIDSYPHEYSAQLPVSLRDRNTTAGENLQDASGEFIRESEPESR